MPRSAGTQYGLACGRRVALTGIDATRNFVRAYAIRRREGSKLTWFNSRRSAVVARRGAVATSQPLAAQAGLKMLMDGGNAVDAAVGAAAALNVVEPPSTGIGGDMFALIWKTDQKKVIALNGSGHSAAAANPDDVRKKGHDRIPRSGKNAAFSVSVPGTVDGWQAALEQHGRMTLKEVLQPAIYYALHGYAVSEVISNGWKSNEEKLGQRPSGREFLPGGRAPRWGETVKLETLGRTMQMIAEGGRDAFYKGEIARKIASFVESEGGWITERDLAEHHSDWDQAISTNYRGVDVWECPPNGQGIAALIALNIAEGFDLPGIAGQSADRYHYLIESMRLAFADTLQYVADPRVTEVPIEGLLSKDYATERRKQVRFDRAISEVTFGKPGPAADTVYVTAVDGEGNACSLINSLFEGFGSGLVVPGTGIALQNRGSLFSLDKSHPNFLQGRKRPYQTIIPAMATRRGEMWLSFGVMGGFQQPQGHLQVVSNMVDYGLDSQRALDALRFSVDVESTGAVRVEAGLDPKVVDGLKRRGHMVTVLDGYERTRFGGGQVISRDLETGVLTAGSEPRKDGAAVGW
ncbi:MAG: gamma-glutamyltransferase [Chloroflexi bacterium]|nr:gamma-glutamyltransferase [Chloroflexota bacterium]